MSPPRLVIPVTSESNGLPVESHDSEPVADLVRRARSGDRDAFRHLVLRHQRIAGGVAYGILGDTHLAADAVQDSFVQAWQKIGQLKEDHKFKSWFLMIVRTRSIDLQRQRWAKVKETYSIDESLDASSQKSPEEQMETQEKSLLIRRLLRELPDDYREILLLKHQLNHSYQEIAKIQGTTPKAVESKIARARKMLAEKWQRVGKKESGDFNG